ncbi:MAG: DUF2752 domain-containing protein [Firmicutes bacterium]|nr:DUF2752 domain-containing protein [Bacillota bacterium]
MAMLYKSSFDSACKHGKSCIFCGLRTAMHYVLRLDFWSAYTSNHLVFIIIALIILSVADTLLVINFYVKRYRL